jgi:multiple sugar transport system permease protein
MVFPIITVFLNAFLENYDYLANTYTGMGMGNFAALFSDKEFLLSLKNTFLYVAFVVPLSTVIALTVAILLNQKLKGSSFFQFVYFLPMVTATIAVGIVWKWMYHYDYGIINYVLGVIGIEPVKWMENPRMALAALIIYGIWTKLPFTIILFLSGLQTIGEQYYTAAKVDGAKPAKILFRITLPLLSPTIALVLIINIINTSKVFNEVFALFNGKPGPGYSLYTVVFYIYENFYHKMNVSIACAAALVLFLIVFIMTMLQMTIQKKWVSR